ncbi:MAG: polyamine ABC transporter ATP-binding protein [Rhodoferax sp.]|uniref:ABC transporter ATP-binding protein n=1 Tax=Rhodoferax sp. TaxID=50421 RepID=UPI0017D36117|nr:polyamine ABC transporter ATP-binding protein [Rhodoferax sp.]NMM12384.1 polyamine ABC transporter ATP-binding protein [Rhodoferax sp.]NMM18749.1 polyamine ABC transporter ATP-binding protein [Rhodoferax sp.]
MLTDASPPLSPAPHRAAPFLQIKRVVKQFDEVYAVDDLSLEIAQGEIFGLLGSSGCGKSTLLRLLAGFELPTSGKILLAGQDIGALAPYERPINMMFQSYALFPHLNVWDNIAFGLRRERLPKADIVARVEQLLELVQLKPYVKRKPHQLSGGQQQRVALARSLAKRPQLLLLDEPLAALDAKLRKKTQLELVDIIEQVGVTCIMVTHDQEEAMTMATRIGVMNEGKLLQIGRPSDIYETPNCRFVADFIGSVNLFEGTLEVDQPDHVLITTPECRHYVSHGITGTLGMALSVAVRPEKMMIQPQPPRDEERESLEQVGFNLVHGVIKDIAYLGNLTTYHVQLDGSITIVRVIHLNDARYEATQLTWGDPVYVWWDGSDVVVLTH